MFARLAASACLLLGLASVSAASAQEVDRIAAVINDDVISIRELEGRVRMALVYAGMQDSLDARRRVAPQVLHKMVDERLQMQEATRLKMSVTAADVDAGIAAIEQQNRLPKGGLLGGLATAGVDPQLAREQIKADMTWMRVTTRVLQNQIKVGEEEIKDRLSTIRERRGKPEYLLAELFLPVDNPAQEDEARQLGERLMEQLKAGTPFQALARQFSRAPTAGNGGVMGWLAQDALDDDMARPVTQINKGQVAPLIRTASGFLIVAMLDQRIAGQVANPEDAEVTLSQVTLPVPPGSPPKQELLARAAQLTAQAKSCPELEAIGRRVGAPTGSLGTKRVGELNGLARRVAATLLVNRVSEPLDTAEGIQVLMVCSRTEALKFSDPTSDQVRHMIEDERMDMLSRRYIRNLRRQAVVEIRG
ncbi:MAG TPA: peptidylprolyl isomerase [Magnetospirillum sp.]|jgi:peptidyl-prolyl cis-trans isomerase SurA|nr:peptidylprolyl isomerase [Magnetospirillum sp.]